jgi:hypothetical protein
VHAQEPWAEEDFGSYQIMTAVQLQGYRPQLPALDQLPGQVGGVCVDRESASNQYNTSVERGRQSPDAVLEAVAVCLCVWGGGRGINGVAE